MGVTHIVLSVSAPAVQILDQIEGTLTREKNVHQTLQKTGDTILSSIIYFFLPAIRTCFGYIELMN